jgi:phosphate transport system permease protein
LGVFVYGLHLGRSIATAGLTLALLILPILIVTTREALRAVPRAVKEAALALGATRWQATKDHVLPAATPGIVTGVIIGMSRALGETAPLITIGALTFVAFLPVRTPGEPLYAQVGAYNADGALQNPGEIARVRLPQGGEALLPDGERRTIPPGAAELPTGTLVKTRVGLAEAVNSWAPWNWLGQSFSALPIQMFNWTSRPDDAFHRNAAAAGLVLLVLTLLMNGAAIWLRYRLRRAIRW